LFAGGQQHRSDRRVPAGLTPQETPQLSHLIASGLREPVRTSLQAREAQ
jgi:hypothetical protein